MRRGHAPSSCKQRVLAVGSCGTAAVGKLVNLEIAKYNGGSLRRCWSTYIQVSESSSGVHLMFCDVHNNPSCLAACRLTSYCSVLNIIYHKVEVSIIKHLKLDKSACD